MMMIKNEKKIARGQQPSNLNSVMSRFKTLAT